MKLSKHIPQSTLDKLNALKDKQQANGITGPDHDAPYRSSGLHSRKPLVIERRTIDNSNWR